MHGRCTTWQHVATHLKTVVLPTPVNEWLDPMKEAPSNEGAFLVSAAPPNREGIGAGYW